MTEPTYPLAGVVATPALAGIVGETHKEAYERGAVAGEISARLAGHDKHFATINGNLVDMTKEIHDLTLAVQRMGDLMASEERTVDKLEDAALTRQVKKDRPLMSVSQWAGIVAVVVAVLGIAITLYLIYNPPG